MAKAISLNLFAFLASVICAVSAYSEPNYPPPGPEWLHDIRAISYVWMYPGMFGKTPEEYAADANAIASNGYNTVVLFGCQDRLSYINKWPEIIAELNEIVPAFHQYGVRVFEHQSLGIVNEDCLDMPIPDSNYTIRDLAQIDANTLQPSYFPDWHVYRICNNNPLTQILINSHIRDIFTQTDIDGLMDDDVSFSKYTCVCQYCRDKAIRECGFDIYDYIPPSSSPGQSFWFNPDDPNYRNWSRFHQNCVGEHYAQMRTLLDGIKPGLGLMGCMAQIVETEHAQIGGADLETLGWGVNLFMHEEISDAYFVEWLPGAVQLVRGLSIGRPSGRPNLNLQYAEYGAAELLFAWALDKTFACRAWCGDENPYRIGREISWEAGHPQLFNKPVVPANVAILYSVQSRDSLRPFMLNRPTEEGPSPDFYGWCEALFYGNIPFHAITEDELTPEKLAPYRILILPSVTCLSVMQCQTISEWTATGGTLIATEDCAMYNETGELLNQSGLSDALGVDINEPELHCQTPVQVPDEGIFRGCGGQIDEPVRTRFACAPHYDAHALGLIEEGATTPAMVSHNFGNGNSVYFAFRLGSAAWTRRMSCFICCDPNNPDPNCSDPDNQYITLGPTTPSSYQVILNLMAPVKPMLAFAVDHDAPLGLIVTLNKLADGKQVLHMLNTTGANFVMDGKLHVVQKHYTQFPLITQDIKVTLREPPALPVTAHLPGGFDTLLDVDTKTNTITVPGYVISPYALIETGAWPSADLNRDGIVDFRDFAILADQWLQKEP